MSILNYVFFGYALLEFVHFFVQIFMKAADKRKRKKNKEKGPGKKFRFCLISILLRALLLVFIGLCMNNFILKDEWAIFGILCVFVTMYW